VFYIFQRLNKHSNDHIGLAVELSVIQRGSHPEG